MIEENAKEPKRPKKKATKKSSTFVPISVKEAEVISAAAKGGMPKSSQKSKKRPPPVKPAKKKSGGATKKSKPRAGIKSATLKRLASVTENLVKVRKELALLQKHQF